MQITDVRLKLIDKENSHLKAVASITIDDAIAIHDVKIIEGSKGLFVGFPSQKIGDKYKDIVHPVKTDIRTMISNKVFAAYYEEQSKVQPEGKI